MVHGRIRYILPQNTSCNAKGILEKLLDHANGPDDENRTSETAFRKQHLPSDVFLTISCVQFRFLLTWLYDNVSRCILKIRWWCTNSCFSPYVSRLVLVDVAPRIRSTIHCKGSHRKWWKGAERKPIDRCNHDWVTSPFQEPVYMGIHLGFKHALARSADSNFVYGIASQGKLADAMAFLSIELNAGSKQIASYGVGPCTRSGTCWFMWALRESDKTRRVNYPLASRPTPARLNAQNSLTFTLLLRRVFRSLSPKRWGEIWRTLGMMTLVAWSGRRCGLVVKPADFWEGGPGFEPRIPGTTFPPNPAWTVPPG